MSDFMEWATVVGGFSGLFSFFYILYEKVKSGPKVISRITDSYYIKRAPSSSDALFNYDFIIDIELGNIGTEMTSLLKPFLKINELDSCIEALFPENDFRNLGVRSLIMRPGYANCMNFRMNHRDKLDVTFDVMTGVFGLRTIGGETILHEIKFELKT